MSHNTPRLSLGPVSYFWSRDDILRLYEQIADSPVDTVYLGETVCGKRRNLNLDDWISVGKQLVDAGKQVVLSSLALIEAESELKALRRICANGEFMVEANDMAAVQLLAGEAPFVAGPFVNIYNSRTLQKLADLGLCRWVLPVELSHETLNQIQAERPQGVETEVFAFGRLPLALSARCFTARAHKLPKDDCQLRCLDYPDGMLLETQEQQGFLNLNGIQTQSAQTYNLLGEQEKAGKNGVDLLRISPQSQHTFRIVQIFHEVLRESSLLDAGQQELNEYMPTGPCDGYWKGNAGLSWTG